MRRSLAERRFKIERPGTCSSSLAACAETHTIIRGALERRTNLEKRTRAKPARGQIGARLGLVPRHSLSGSRRARSRRSGGEIDRLAGEWRAASRFRGSGPGGPPVRAISFVARQLIGPGGRREWARRAGLRDWPARLFPERPPSIHLFIRPFARSRGRHLRGSQVRRGRHAGRLGRLGRRSN